jgi:anti-sigma-K factor RskA
MSGTEDLDPDLLAAEYVLGTLEGRERESVARRAETDDALNSAILAWEMRLEPLAGLVRPVPPPANLWARIEASCGLGASARRGASSTLRSRLWDTVGFWRGATGLGFGLAVAIAALAIFHTPPAPQVPIASAVLAAKPGVAPAFVAEASANGTIDMRPLTRVAVAEGKDLELWVLPDGTSVPKPLGVIKASGQTVVVPPALRNRAMAIMISLEQQGGSSTGLPQGPVLFVGHFDRID